MDYNTLSDAQMKVKQARSDLLFEQSLILGRKPTKEQEEELLRLKRALLEAQAKALSAEVDQYVKDKEKELARVDHEKELMQTRSANTPSSFDKMRRRG